MVMKKKRADLIDYRVQSPARSRLAARLMNARGPGQRNGLPRVGRHAFFLRLALYLLAGGILLTGGLFLCVL